MTTNNKRTLKLFVKKGKSNGIRFIDIFDCFEWITLRTQWCFTENLKIEAKKLEVFYTNNGHTVFNDIT